MKYHQNSKQVLRDGLHFADCINDIAAADIVAAMKLLQESRKPRPQFAPFIITHTIQQQQDEYACSCGMRWAVSDGDDHP